MEISELTLPQALELFRYWNDFPPAHECLRMLAIAAGFDLGKPMTQADHRKSLEQRWAAGAMNVKQMFEALGGHALGATGVVGDKITSREMPGIGPFPDTLTRH